MFTARRAAYRKLHESGCFVIPNPWDAGSALYLRHLGFQALATTSAGCAFSLGLPDAAVSRDAMLANIAAIVAATDLPVNADFESGYARDPEGVAANVRLCIDTGVAGLSIEDATGDKANPLFELPRALDRVRAARAAIDASNTGVVFTARAECFLVGHPDPLKESLRRLDSLRRSRRRRPLRPRRRHSRRHQDVSLRTRPQAHKRSDVPQHGTHRPRPGRPRRPPHQRRLLAFPSRLDRLHARRRTHRQRRQLRRLQRSRPLRRNQRLLPRRYFPCTSVMIPDAMMSV